MNEREREKELDFLKGIMIVCVIFTHSHYASIIRGDNPFFPFFVDIAVPVFLIISGYVNSISFCSKSPAHGIIFERNSLFRKINRIIIPFIPCIFICFFFWIFIDHYNLKWFFIDSIFQRWGDGGYYPFIMLQFILLFPILYYASKSVLYIILTLLVNLISELAFCFCVHAFNNYGGSFEQISEVLVYTHRICIFRYLAFILAGILLYRFKPKIQSKTIILTGLTGFVLVYWVNYYLKSDIFFGLWRSTSMPTVFYASFIVMLFLFSKKYSKFYDNVLVSLFNKIGKSSYFVFLTQMAYYFLIKHGVFKEPPFFASIAVCSSLGCLYSMLYNNIFNQLKKKSCSV